MSEPFQFPTDDAQWVQDIHANHYLQSWSVQGNKPIVITGAQGSWFWDSNGKRYLDFQSQLVNLNLGHQHPKIIEAIKQQADKLCYISPAMGNDARSELAALIAQITPGDLNTTFFTCGGASANETAIRIARHFTGRQKIIARYRSYHGATGGALSLTGDPRHHLTKADMPGIVRILDPYPYRPHSGHKDPANCPVCQGAPYLEDILQFENPNTVAAMIIEPIVGTNGIIVPPDGYLQSIRETCKKYGILLIMDEVMAGFGRTGKWFAGDHWNIVPDIITAAKGINSGYVPLGIMSVNQAIADWLKTCSFPSGLTYAGHPLACASGVAAINAMIEENTLQQATTSGELMRSRLTMLMNKHPCIGEVRGKGLFNGIELVKNRNSKEPLVPYAAKGEAAKPVQNVLNRAMENGLFLSGFSNCIRLAPPLNISRDDLLSGLDILDDCLDIADNYCS